MTELETQYKSLFEKYEQLIQNKNKRLSQVDAGVDPETAEDRAARRRQAHKEVQTLLHMTLNRDYYSNPEPCQPPPYKALFKDLFATLRKTKIEENPGEQDGGGAKLTATTPGDAPVPPLTPGDPPSSSTSMEFSRVAASLSDLSKGLLVSPVATPGWTMEQALKDGAKNKDKSRDKDKNKDNKAVGGSKEKDRSRSPKPKTDKKGKDGKKDDGSKKVLTSAGMMTEEVYES